MIGSVAHHITSDPLLLALPVAVAAGLVSFLSPCVLPLVPGYLGFITGLSGAQLAGEAASGQQPRGRTGLRILAAGLLFVLGFSIVFVSFGAAFGGLGQTLREHETMLNRVFGVFTIMLGLAFCGLLGFLPLVGREFRVHRTPRAGLVGAPLLGVMFALGWTPCIGPTLAAVLGLAASTDGTTARRGAVLAFAYCFGLGLPFLVTGLAFERSLGAFRVVRRHYRLVTALGGGLLIVVGLAELTGTWQTTIDWLQSNTPWNPSLPL